MDSLVNLGYMGLFVGSFMASTIVPFSADVLLIGVLSMDLNVWYCLLWATLGNWLGGMTSYYIGWLGNVQRIEKWFKISPEKLKRQQMRVVRYDVWLALLTWLPMVGDVFAIALGFYQINWMKSAWWMLLGRFLRFLIWIGLYLYFADDFVRFLKQ